MKLYQKLLTILVASVTITQPALAKELYFWYDPNSNCITGYTASDASMTVLLDNDNASTTMGFLLQNGYSKAAAAGILGNIANESAFNPRVLQGGAVVDENFVAYIVGKGKTFSGGFGLVQWTTASRVAYLQKFADNNNEKVTSLSLQLKFMLKELKDYGLGPDILNQYDVAGATKIIFDKYEGPGDDTLPKRTESAEEYYNNLTPSNTGLTDQSKSAFCLNDNIMDYLDGSGFVYYFQCDPSWGSLRFGVGGINGNTGGTICGSGCGPTSFATIASNLLQQKITPDQTTDIAGRANTYVPGAGSSWSITEVLAKHYGFQYKNLPINISTINQYLADGWMIHTSGKGSAPYSSGGHYIAILGLTPEGNWIVANSAKKESGISVYKPEEVVHAGMHNVRAVHK